MIIYVDYDKKEKILTGEIYFKRPTTRHTNPDVVSKKAILTMRIKK